MAKLQIILGLITCCLMWVFFLIFPDLDITLATHFYDPLLKKSFIGNYSSFLSLLHWLARFLPIFFSVVVILFLLASLFVKTMTTKHRKLIIFITMCLWIGPGLIVNYVFKDHWGRPRPAMVSQFKGDKVFQPPFVISSQCDKNCSFVCGDASLGFWLFALVPLMSTRKKKILAFCIAILAGSGLGLMRMSQGGHFFSDVIFCGIFVYICTWVIYWFMYEKNIKVR